MSFIWADVFLTMDFFLGGGGRGGVFKVLESLKANIVVEIVFSYTSVLI